MKILFISNGIEFCKKGNNNKLNVSDINSYGCVYAYFLQKYLCKFKNVEVIFLCSTKIDTNNKDNLINYIPECDHCICFHFGLFKNIDYYNTIRTIVKDKITIIGDNNKTINIGHEDAIFYSVSVIDKPLDKAIYVGWAADSTHCYIDKDDSEINILIDHSAYIKESIDFSKLIISDICKFCKKYKKNIKVRRFISDGVETLDINNPWFELYNRKGLSFDNACKEYNKAHIFIVTHYESLGLSVIEAAMSGALILVPDIKNGAGSCIHPNLLESLHHITFDPFIPIPWSKVINNINPTLSRKKALNFTYEKVADRIYNYLSN